MPTMEIKRIQAGHVNCYLLASGRDAVLVDTGMRPWRDKVLGACRNYHVRLLVLTHGHLDHTQNTAYLTQCLQVPVAMNGADLDLLRDNLAQAMDAEKLPGKVIAAGSAALSRMGSRIAAVPEFQPGVFLEEGDTLEKWGIPARVIALPGHTNGSIGLEILDKHLLVGDALMNMLYPTASLLYNDRVEMLESARKIAKMGERTIWFGHGKPAANRDWVR